MEVGVLGQEVKDPEEALVEERKEEAPVRKFKDGNLWCCYYIGEEHHHRLHIPFKLENKSSVGV